MSNILFGDRTFQLWEYRVSHGSLLIRSPIGPGVTTNIDIICVGVEYLAVPRFLRNMQIVEPTADELCVLEEILAKPLMLTATRIFTVSDKRFPIVAAGFKIDENENDIFDSPFE